MTDRGTDMGDNFWNADRVELLRVLVAEGMSYKQIGYELGCNRNSAIGKAHRLGLTGPAVRIPKPRAVRKTPMRTKPVTVTPPKPQWHPAPHHIKTPAEVLLDDGVFRPVGVEYAAMEDHHCRWPLDDGRICGRNRAGGRRSYYCDHHGKAAVNPVRMRAACAPVI